ncbi:hypothetical protein HNP86_001817 [Methanococcus maripaludis]|uniref:Uncharacterized protein n=1 Tax=Methanococcus maripaludis TaxID=39152 RepID=A0A7J9NVF5_METMI|nr:hypothetical protein [Methanococcus maripaludis]MBA2851658.1 hypothetical protein [Methanococcus maripaludis]
MDDNVQLNTLKSLCTDMMMNVLKRRLFTDGHVIVGKFSLNIDGASIMIFNNSGRKIGDVYAIDDTMFSSYTSSTNELQAFHDSMKSLLHKMTVNSYYSGDTEKCQKTSDLKCNGLFYEDSTQNKPTFYYVRKNKCTKVAIESFKLENLLKYGDIVFLCSSTAPVGCTLTESGTLSNLESDLTVNIHDLLVKQVEFVDNGINITCSYNDEPALIHSNYTGYVEF